MTSSLVVLSAVSLLVINLLALFFMWQDKMSARVPGRDRVPEGTLFFVGIIGGSVGLLIGMFLFRHKTRSWPFLIGVPLLIIENAVTLIVFMRWLEPIV